MQICLVSRSSMHFKAVLNERDEENRQAIMKISEGKVADALIEEAAAIRNEMGELKTHFKTRLTEEITGLRNEMVRGDESIRSEIHSTRADLLKWMSIFRVGQVGVINALLLTIAG